MRRFALCILMLLTALPAFATEGGNAAPKANLTILTDESMLLPLARLSRSYAAATGTPLTVVLKNADDAERQIEQGLEAHSVISANRALMNRLSEQGLTDVTSRRTVARTPLALVTASPLSKQALVAKRISFASMLAATPGLPIFTSAPGTAEGDLAQALLNRQDFSEKLAPRIHTEATHEEVVEALRDSEGLGLMLAADASTERDLTVLALLPEEISPPLAYDALVLGGDSMEEAKAFVAFLSTARAQAIFAHFGFQTAAE